MVQPITAVDLRAASKPVSLRNSPKIITGMVAATRHSASQPSGEFTRPVITCGIPESALRTSDQK
jgi:hypothetical protein